MKEAISVYLYIIYTKPLKSIQKNYLKVLLVYNFFEKIAQLLYKMGGSRREKELV
jgi:hypothetical protein